MNDPVAQKAVKILNEIMQYELAGVVRYTHYAVRITGPNRLPLVDFMKAQAAESLAHAQSAGEILTGLGGCPKASVAPVEEHGAGLPEIIEASYRHEMRALSLYKELLSVVADHSVYLEEYARGMIGQEELHTMELKKMLAGGHDA